MPVCHILYRPIVGIVRVASTKRTKSSQTSSEGRSYFLTMADIRRPPPYEPMLLTTKKTILSCSDTDPWIMNCVVVDELVKSTQKADTAVETSGKNPISSMAGFITIPPPMPRSPAITPLRYEFVIRVCILVTWISKVYPCCRFDPVQIT